VVLARDLRLSSLTTSVLVRGVGGSWLRVRVSGAPKLREVGFEGMDRGGKWVSMNLQFANLTLYKLQVRGSKYRIMDGESNPT
jgi:hypothetical protein